MNICLFTSTFLPKTGGLENVVDTLAKTFIRLGHNVVVLAKTPRGMKEPPKFDYPVHYYKRSRSEVWFLGSPKRELLRLHKQYKFDIIHAHQIYPTGWLAGKFSVKPQFLQFLPPAFGPGRDAAHHSGKSRSRMPGHCDPHSRHCGNSARRLERTPRHPRPAMMSGGALKLRRFIRA